MLANKFIAQSGGIKHTHYRAGSLMLTKAIYPVGGWMDLEYPECAGYAFIDTSHIQPVGTLIDPAEVLHPREPGWMSSEDFFPIPAGVHRRLAITPAEVWCARPRDKVSSVWALNEVRVPAGNHVVLVPGDNLLIAHGSLSCDGKVIAAQTHLVIQSDEKTLYASELTYVFQWRDDVL